MKKLLLTVAVLAGLTSFSAKISGPKHGLEAGAGVDIVNPTLHVTYYPEWKADINKNFDITFGPKISAIGEVLVGAGGAPKGGAFLVTAGIGADFNVALPNTTNKFYVGLETGGGLGYIKATKTEKTENSETTTTVHGVTYIPIGKIALGGKFSNGFKVAGYTGYGKGIVGLEVGYTF
ncbi:hypothetical protein STFE110948_04270 [Streptobacillus felis]|uniref:Outer membrane protein beta-barrel domain-containing protein n=1 Tax=Streptobacillus felis TaxID=1384509 RepID=A0A7Z0PFA4_9FUSO|nr:hypothetical protein [Streptobacillus felis]NYV27497.1 hypothetical protein [Streptobacillus felis]